MTACGSTTSSAISRRASSQLTRFHLPSPRAPARRSSIGDGALHEAPLRTPSAGFALTGWAAGFVGAVLGAMALVCVSANAILFLAAWEVMALANFFVITTEENVPAVRRAG